MMSSKQDQNSTPWDRMTHYYLNHALNLTTENRRILWLLLKYLKKNEKFNSFLEVGCACGSLYGILKQKYGRAVEDKYFGLDISKNSIIMAQMLFPGGWFKWADVRDHKLIQKRDIVYSSEVLPHLPLKDQNPVIARLVRSASKMCLFSMKFSDVEPLEHEYEVKELTSYYTFPNAKQTIDFVNEIKGDDWELIHYKKYGFNKPFVKNTKFHGKTGNLTIQLIKKERKLK